jgi:hypothetical protein
MSNHRVGGNETRKAETLDREREIVRLLKEGVGRTEVAAMLGYKNKSGLNMRISLLREQGDLDGVKILP